VTALRRDVTPYLRVAFWGVLAWAVTDTLYTAQSLIWYHDRALPLPWGRYAANYFDSLYFGIMAPLALWVTDRWPLGRQQPWRRLGIHLFTATAIHTGYFFTMQPVRGVLAVLFDDSMIYRTSNAWLYLQTWFGALMLYGQMIAVTHGMHYYARWRDRELRASRLEAQLVQAQLQMLRMQLHPHFLFNTLHSVSSLMHTDVKAADRILALLGDLLRDSLDKVGSQLITLKQEIDFIDRYLEIERTRFRDRLKAELRVEADTWDALVPSFVLQPLVENAIRHGVSRKTQSGRLTVTATREGSRLVLSVTDDGPGLPGEGAVPGRSGVGLSNTRARLVQLYGRDGVLELRNGRDGGAEARVEIPFQTTADEPATADSPAAPLDSPALAAPTPAVTH
jgi:signal transduction histidine kinase